MNCLDIQSYKIRFIFNLTYPYYYFAIINQGTLHQHCQIESIVLAHFPPNISVTFQSIVFVSVNCQVQPKQEVVMLLLKPNRSKCKDASSP